MSRVALKNLPLLAGMTVTTGALAHPSDHAAMTGSDTLEHFVQDPWHLAVAGCCAGIILAIVLVRSRRSGARTRSERA